MGVSFSNDDEPISTINVTPFVDIILVVLIIFMVTAPVLPRINIELPKAASGEDSSLPSQMNITINKEGVIQLNGESIEIAALAEKALQMSSQSPDIQAIVSADQDVSHGQVISVIDTIKQAGINKFAISVERKQ